MAFCAWVFCSIRMVHTLFDLKDQVAVSCGWGLAGLFGLTGS